MNKIFNNQYIKIFLIGLVSSLIFAPFYLFPIAFISFPYFYNILNGENNIKKTYYYGWCFGFGHYISGLYWIANALFIDIKQFWFLLPFALLGIPALLATLFTGPFALCFNFIKRKNFTLNLFIFASLWVLFEWLRSYLFTGLPWNLTGYALGFSNELMQISAYGGVYLASFIVILSAISLTYWQQNKNVALIIISFYIILFAFGYLRINYTKLVIDDQKNIIRIVQPNINQDLKYSDEGKFIALKTAINMTKENLHHNITAIIWPEAAIDFLLDVDKQLPIISNLLSENQVLISGALRLEKKKSLILC
jgi:apolipoprotein N-acyltransferase